MNSFVNNLVKYYALSRRKRLDALRYDAIDLQEKLLIRIIEENSGITYLKSCGIARNPKADDFLKLLPLVQYEDLFPYIQRMMDGESNVLVPGAVNWFSKSSGTTNAKSKYVPVTRRFMNHCYTRSNWDVVTTLYHHNPNLKIFANKNLIMGGSLNAYEGNAKVKVGDVSAIMLDNMPGFAKKCYTPDFTTALMDDWDKKLSLMTKQCIKDHVILFAGVPTWLLSLFNMMLDFTGKNNMLEIWPEASVYLHGGVGFGPYRKQFQQLFPKEDFIFLETYNASEGFFAFQDDLSEDGMLLLTNNEIYYEFIPLSQVEADEPELLPLSEVKVEQDYEMVITTNSGLWRYRLGDVISFTSVSPYRIKIKGRTKEFINVFGEELMVHNAERALVALCGRYNVSFNNYTVAPIFMDYGTKARHQWLIEFKDEPNDLMQFAEGLDRDVQRLNSDYEAKRSADIILSSLEVVSLPKGTFEKWQRLKNRFGGQSKVPRLSNERKLADELLQMNTNMPYVG